MKKSSKVKFVILLTIFFLSISLFVVLYKIGKGNNKVSEENISKTVIQFSFPSNLKLEKKMENGRIVLSHFIKYKGSSICDPDIMSDDSRALFTTASTSKTSSDNANFDELEFEIKIVSSSIRQLFPEFDKYTQPDAFGFSYLEEIKVGNEIGYSALNAVEMCGWINNYFPRPYGTLIISQNAEKIALRGMGKFKEVDDALSDEDVKQIFEMIVKTAGLTRNR